MELGEEEDRELGEEEERELGEQRRTVPTGQYLAQA